MNAEQHRVAAAIHTACAEGKSVQYRPQGGARWFDVPGATVAYVDTEYQWRVKPEPLEFWTNVYGGGDFGKWHRSAESARLAAGGDAIRIAVHFREVTP